MARNNVHELFTNEVVVTICSSFDYDIRSTKISNSIMMVMDVIRNMEYSYARMYCTWYYNGKANCNLRYYIHTTEHA